MLDAYYILKLILVAWFFTSRAFGHKIKGTDVLHL